MQNDNTVDPILPQGFSETFPARFWSKVNKNGPIPETNPSLGRCWLWKGNLRRCNHRTRTLPGYGQIRIAGSRTNTWSAHRAAYAFLKGEIGEGMYVCHRCDNANCVNPEHLYVGTQRENIRDRQVRQRDVVHFGEDHANHRLTWKIVREMRALFDMGWRVCEIASIYGLYPGYASAIIRKKLWPEPADES